MNSTDVKKASTENPTIRLRILGTSDLHMQIHPFDYYQNRPDHSGSLTQIADLVDKAREGAPNNLLFDVGDHLQGNPMGDFAVSDRKYTNKIHPMIAAMNQLAFDGATVGNHDFNYGLDFLEGCIADACFPVVCANVQRTPGNAPLFPEFCILDRNLKDNKGNLQPVKIGIVGFTPPQITQWDAAVLAGDIATTDIVETAKSIIPQMKSKGADIIIALAHTGIGAAKAQSMMENAAIPLAAIDGLDALFLGHSHIPFRAPSPQAIENQDPKLVHHIAKPTINTGARGAHLGVMDLHLVKKGNRWAIDHSDCQLWPVEPPAAQENAIVRVTLADHLSTIEYTGQPVGNSQIPLHSYFAQLGYSTALDLVAQAQKSWVERVVKGGVHSDLPIISATAPFKSGGLGGPTNYTDIDAGPLAIRNIADICPFPNTIAAHVVSGRCIRDWLDHAAGQFNQILPSSIDVPLLNPEFPGYHFDLLYGLAYDFDLSQPARYDPNGRLQDPKHSRVSALNIGGNPLRDNDECILITNNFRVGGGGGYPRLKGRNILGDTKKPTREAITEFISDGAHQNIGGGRVVSFKSIPNTSAIFETGMGADRYKSALHDLSLEALPHESGVFHKYRIRF